MAVSPTEIIFSTEQQQALLGHAVTNEKVYEQCTLMGVTTTWFHSANHQSIWGAVEKFIAENRGHHPTLAELRSTQPFKNDEQKIIQARAKALDAALASVSSISFDSISNELREWAKGQAFVKNMETAADLYNRKDVAKAYDTVSRMNIEIERIDAVALNARCLDSGTRSKGERKVRMEQKDKVLQFGVTYLDEATGGIGPNEVVLLGAETGVGKTQLAITIAGHNSRTGKRVAMFALEAEVDEVERRLKFAVLQKMYRAHMKEKAEELNYRDWRHGLLEDKLGVFEDNANSFMDSQYSNIRTIYKGWGDYDIHKLERDIIRLAPTVDLIIVDHLHYIDSEGANENREMKEMLQVLRDLALYLSKPIVLIAHLRKNQGGRKNTPLVRTTEDFMGSSDIGKIATLSIMLAPCYENFDLFPSGIVPPFFCRNGAPERLWATYMRITKYRVDGGVTRYTAIGFFDEVTGGYRPQYAIGRLASADTVWNPEKYRPNWAKSGTLHLNGTND